MNLVLFEYKIFESIEDASYEIIMALTASIYEYRRLLSIKKPRSRVSDCVAGVNLRDRAYCPEASLSGSER